MAGRARQRRRWALGGSAFVALLLLLATDRSGAAGSRLNLVHLARTFALVGLLAMGQQVLRRFDVADLGAGAVMALSAALAVGLSSDLQPWGGAAGGLAVALAVGLATAAVLRASGAPALLVTLLPVLVAPAALPGTWVRPAPPLLQRFADGTVAGLPWLLWLYLVLVGGVGWLSGPRLADLRRRLPADLRLVAACGGVSLCWGVLGLWWAGLDGAPSAVPLWPAAVGLGAALVAEPNGRGRPDLVAGGLAAAVVAVLLNGLELRAGGMGLGFETGARGLLAALVLLAGLLARPSPRSAHAEQLRGDDLDVDAPRHGHDQPEAPPLAGGDGGQ